MDIKLAQHSIILFLLFCFVFFCNPSIRTNKIIMHPHPSIYPKALSLLFHPLNESNIL